MYIHIYLHIRLLHMVDLDHVTSNGPDQFCFCMNLGPAPWPMCWAHGAHTWLRMWSRSGSTVCMGSPDMAWKLCRSGSIVVIESPHMASTVVSLWLYSGDMECTYGLRRWRRSGCIVGIGRPRMASNVFSLWRVRIIFLVCWAIYIYIYIYIPLLALVVCM